jgi:hypothetical protein
VAYLVGLFVLALVVGWAGVGAWRSSWRPQLLAWLGLVGLPLFVVYLGVRATLTVGGCVAAAAAWLACAVLRLLPARRSDAGGGRRTPS